MNDLTTRDNNPPVLDHETIMRLRCFWIEVYDRAMDKVGYKEAKIVASKVLHNQLAELTTTWEG